MTTTEYAIYGLLAMAGTAIAFQIIRFILEPIGRRIEDAINRWLCWREIRKAGR